MKRAPRAAVLAALLFAALSMARPATAALAELTQAEREWLARRNVVHVGVDRIGEDPIEVVGNDGSWHGIAPAVLKRVANRLDVTLELHFYRDRAAVLAAAQRGEIDIVPAAIRTSELARSLVFTQHYVYGHSVLLKHPAFQGVSVPTVAAVRGRHGVDALATRLRKFKLLDAPDARSALQAVESGKAEAYAGALLPLLRDSQTAAALANLQQEALDAGEVRIAVRSDLPLLASALDKGIASFTPAELAAIARGWEGEREARTPTFALCPDERASLDQVKRLRVAFDAAFEPFSFLQGGEPAGMSVDYLRAIAERLGVELEFQPASTFGAALDAVLDAKADMLAAAARTPERRRYLRFAGPTFSQPTALITRMDKHTLTGLADIAPGAVALPEGYFLRERLAKEYPQARVLGCRDTEDCLKAVANGHAVATLGNLAVISPLIERRFPGQLRVSGVIPDAPSELYVAVATGRPELQSLFQRALDSMPPERHAAIRAPWRTVQYSEGISIERALQVALPILAVGLLVMGIVAFSNRRLAREVEKRRATEAELRVARDHAEAATRAKSGFLAMMSHEIRTPMHGVLGVLDVLGQGKLTGDQQALVNAAGSSARSLLALLNDLLDFSKIEAGKLRLDPADADLRAVARAAVELFATQAAEKGVALTLDVDPGLAARHRFDEVRVGQVLTNLVSNAVKFTLRGSVGVRLSCEEDGPGHQRVRIAVRDSGIGIAPQEQARLFVPFEQAESSTTRRYGGTGLGLAICRRIAEEMGGEIALESAKGTGSTFTFTARLQVAPAPAHAAAPPRAAAAGARILVVEDQPVNRMVVRRQLELLGHAVEVADDGAAGLEAWRRGGFDLVLADHHMPVMDGDEMVRRLREEERARPGAARTPVLLLSAERVDAMPGVDASLLKPIDTQSLEAAIAQALRAAPPIDREGLARTLGDAGAVEATLQALRASLGADVAAVREALRERRMDDARRGAHRVLGAARTVGAQRLERAAAALQEAAGSSDFARAAAAFEELEGASAEVDNAIEDKMGS